MRPASDWLILLSGIVKISLALLYEWMFLFGGSKSLLLGFAEFAHSKKEAVDSGIAVTGF